MPDLKIVNDATPTPFEFPFDKTLLLEIVVRIDRLHPTERRWLLARIQAGMPKEPRR